MNLYYIVGMIAEETWRWQMQKKEYKNIYLNYLYTLLDLKILKLLLLRSKVSLQGVFLIILFSAQELSNRQ